MDIVTHGLASLAVARAFFPRAGKDAMVAAVAAGVLADGDSVSYYFGPPAFLAWHRTYFHSLFGALLFAVMIAVIVRAVLKALQKSFALSIFAASFSAALLHLAMDACQSDAVMLLWPFSSLRFAADWLPGLDPWILTILIACIAVPELLRLVGSEIGAKEKKPRGQRGALVGLLLVFIYAGVRGTLHSNVVAALESRSFHGETARHARAFPESLSLFTWHGVAETENALNQIQVDAASLGALDADNSLRLFKPQNSPALDQAKNTGIAKHFLSAAQIPKAGIEKTTTGYLVVIRDLRFAASGETGHEISALIDLDLSNKVVSQELVWARDLPR